MKNILQFLDKMTPVQKIAFSFIFVILIGAILLTLPFTHKNGVSVSFIDALFIATSGTCVTGLSTLCVADTFNIVGQIILLIMIQIGGLGLMTLIASVTLLLRNRLTLYDKLAMKEVLNIANMVDFKSFISGILHYVFSWEILGTVLLSIYFIPKMGIKGLFVSIFTSISAFCNAGFDIFGSTSVIAYQDNVLVMITLMLLIIFSGLGFVVWFDIRDKFKLMLKEKGHLKKFSTSLMLHTKIVLIMTLGLIFIPAILFFMIEYNNPETFGHMSLGIKIINALFTSITLRTAGFANISYGATHSASQILMHICMFIGGSPGGTAGGVKTTTIAILFICVICSMKGKSHTNVFKKHISRSLIVNAMTLVIINLCVLFLGIFLLSISETFTLQEIIFEAVSALATVGLSLGITSSLSLLGKIIIIFMMYFGRIGITTFIYVFVREDKYADILEYPEGHIIVG